MQRGKIMETLAIIATVCGTAVTFIWFLRDMRKENSKVLKEIAQGQKEGLKSLAEILERIEKGHDERHQELIKTLSTEKLK